MYANVFFILYSFWVQQKQIAYVIRVIERLCTTIKKTYNEAGFTDLFFRLLGKGHKYLDHLLYN